MVAAAGVLVITVFGYAGDRISVWLDPESDPLGDGFQVLQSLYAIGSGGLTGLGIGQSRQKYLYLPEEHNDYIFPIVCEELGFIGALLVLLLFALLISRGFGLPFTREISTVHLLSRALPGFWQYRCSQHRRCYKSFAKYGHLTAVFQLRRNGNMDADDRDGHNLVHIEGYSCDKGGVRLRLLFTCAGTAGHINPAIAVAGYFKRIMPDTEMLFIGSGREMENRLIPMAGFDIVNIKSKGFQRGFSPAT